MAVRCPSCTNEIADPRGFCPVCGTRLSSDQDQTGQDLGLTQPASKSAIAAAHSAGRAGSGAGPLPHEGSERGLPPSEISPRFSETPATSRFVPGTVLAGRYRIAGMLGRGGMGEVYLAEDLTLSQPVALKFLPDSLAADPERLSAFRQEVRIARQVSHPNVCRVYDIGQIDGQHFLSMEYIDGEDLASLLRRIGRLPSDKATEIARQLCAGLAAAHDKGVLHRDLKPSNVMIDGRGRARITDFGLAGLAVDLETDGVRAGTPAYMAPEQIAGEELSIRSDLYALGLVLYETYTGKPAFQAESLAEFARLHRESAPTHPSTIVHDVDPAVERVIMRCLAKEPGERPPSAMAVAAALPGADPLAAALAAGETPSPELVAASGEVGGLSSAVGWLCLVTILAGLLLVARFKSETALVNRVPLERTPQVLADRAREILDELGYTDEPHDHASGFSVGYDLLQYVSTEDHSPDRWDVLATGRPSAINFWYRQSPRLLIASETDGIVRRMDPPPLVPGMAMVRLDPSGRLLELEVVPPEEETAGPWENPDWSLLVEAADFDLADLRPAAARWTPPEFCDQRRAWLVEDASIPGGEFRVEAGAYHGRPVFFRVAGVWQRASEVEPTAGAARVSSIIEIVMIIAMLVGALLLAVRNIRLGRGDRGGAKRLAWYVFLVMMVAWALGASHVPSGQGELGLLVNALGPAFFYAGTMWLVYMALEPYVRRRSPHRIVAWSRLFSGRLRDPLVGRDVLIGVMFGLGTILAGQLLMLIPGWLGRTPPQPFTSSMFPAMGTHRVLSLVLYFQPQALFSSLFFIFVPILLQVILRRYWLAVGVFFVLTSTIFVFRADNPAGEWPIYLLIVGGFIFVMVRFGLLALVVQFYVLILLTANPITPDPSAWYFGTSLLVLAITVGLAIFGFYTALAGRPMFASEFLRE